jgi:hypothetical protein
MGRGGDGSATGTRRVEAFAWNERGDGLNPCECFGPTHRRGTPGGRRAGASPRPSLMIIGVTIQYQVNTNGTLRSAPQT